MSLLNDASLVMIPSGYKDTKLYSVKPTDGSGDFTFSRGSNLAATRVNSEGLIEKGRENLLLQSNSFDTTWFNSNSTETGGQSGYDGSSDAWLLQSTTNGNAYLRQTYTNSGVQTFSFYAKAGNVNFVQVYVTGADSSHYFNLSAGTAETPTGLGKITSKITSVGSGWYRCECIHQGSSTGANFYIRDAVGGTASIGDNILIQDAQLEQGLVATEYIETTTTTEQAGILEDMPRLDYSGGATCPSLLLEPQRSNLVTQSEYGGDYLYINTSYVQNTQVSPEGVINSITIESDTTNATHYFGSNFNFFTSGTTYTSSIFIKKGTGRYFQLTYGSGSFGIDQYANYDLQDGVVTYEASLATASIEDFGNGWYRCVLTATATSNFNDRFYAVFITSGTAIRVQSHSSSLNYYFYGFQMEEGSYPTSYIPTYGASVTRSEDICNDTGLSSVIGQTEGTLFLDFNPLEFAYTSRYLSIESASGVGSGWIGIFATSPNQFRFYGDGFDIDISSYSVGDRAKIALTYQNGVATNIYINGVNKGSITANTTGKDYSILRIGKAAIGGIGAGEFKQVLVFPTALTDAECEQLTTI